MQEPGFLLDLGSMMQDILLAALAVVLLTIVSLVLEN